MLSLAAPPWALLGPPELLLLHLARIPSTTPEAARPLYVPVRPIHPQHQKILSLTARYISSLRKILQMQLLGDEHGPR